MLLVGSLVVRVPRRKHHAFDAQLHHLVKERAYALGIGTVEQSRIRGHAEAAVHRFAHAVESLVVAALQADRSEEHTSELQSPCNLVCRLLLEKKKNTARNTQLSRFDSRLLSSESPAAPLPPASRYMQLFISPSRSSAMRRGFCVTCCSRSLTG